MVKISLTMKNNLIHITLFIPVVAIITMFALTNARYEFIANLSGSAYFPYTALTITPYVSNNYEMVVGSEIKLKYEITNSENSNINTNNLQYYLNVLDDNGNELENIDVNIRESAEDESTFDTAIGMDYISNKGYGPITLKCDGTEETIIYDVFLKCESNTPAGEYSLKLQVYAESITNVNFNLEMEENINLNIVGGSNIEPLSNELVDNITNEDLNPSRLYIPANNEIDNTDVSTPGNETTDKEQNLKVTESNYKNENEENTALEKANEEGNVSETENVQAENNIIDEKEVI